MTKLKEGKFADERHFKEAISKLINEYKTIYRSEYNEFLKGVKVRVSLNKDKFASTGKNVDFLERRILEYPETLHAIFVKRLGEESLRYLYSREGARWMAKQFKEFRVGEKL